MTFVNKPLLVKYNKGLAKISFSVLIQQGAEDKSHMMAPSLKTIKFNNMGFLEYLIIFALWLPFAFGAYIFIKDIIFYNPKKR